MHDQIRVVFLFPGGVCRANLPCAQGRSRLQSLLDVEIVNIRIMVDQIVKEALKYPVLFRLLIGPRAHCHVVLVDMAFHIIQNAGHLLLIALIHRPRIDPVSSYREHDGQ